MSLKDSIRLFVEEESKAVQQLLLHEQPIESLIEVISTSMKSGGRLFYVGAGTSGRLGVIDASECYSTFSTSVDTVQGIIAGGIQAVYQPFDCAEETFFGGVSAVKDKEISSKDVLIGISASGTTPFTWGGLFHARNAGAYIALITFNPYLVFSENLKPDRVIAVDVGPEILTGSTRLKCGTTTKVLINMISTLCLGVRMARVQDNLMVNLHPSNSKLKQRALRILMSLIPQTEDLESTEGKPQEYQDDDVEERVSSSRESKLERLLVEHEYDVQEALSRLMKPESD